MIPLVTYHYIFLTLIISSCCSCIESPNSSGPNSSGPGTALFAERNGFDVGKDPVVVRDQLHRKDGVTVAAVDQSCVDLVRLLSGDFVNEQLSRDASHHFFQKRELVGSGQKAAVGGHFALAKDQGIASQDVINEPFQLGVGRSVLNLDGSVAVVGDGRRSARAHNLAGHPRRRNEEKQQQPSTTDGKNHDGMLSEESSK